MKGKVKPDLFCFDSLLVMRLGEILSVFTEPKLATREYLDTIWSILFSFIVYVGLSTVSPSPVVEEWLGCSYRVEPLSD